MTHKRNTSGLKPFVKGKSGNPLGGKLHNPEVKALKTLTQKELVRIGNMVINGKLEDLVAFRKKLARQEPTDKSVIEAMVIGLALKAVKGDQGAFEAIMCRLIGKVPDKIHHGGPNGGPQLHAVLPVTGSELEKVLKAALKKVEEDF